MARILKTRGAPGAARLLVADFDGYVRDGATLKLRGRPSALRDGDLIAFRHGSEMSAGISISEDAQGLHSLIGFGPSMFLRIGLEAQGDGVYAFRPAPHHMDILPELAAAGAGAKVD